MTKCASQSRAWVLVAALGIAPVAMVAWGTAPVQAETPPPPPAAPSLNPVNMVPAPPTLAASSWVLLDAKSGQIILDHNAHERVPPASLTKLMTAFIAEYEVKSGRLSEDAQVRISEHAWRTGGSRMFLKVNTTVPVNELMKGIVIQSGNDASVAMAEHIAGTEDAFAQLMNQHAASLGMKDTHFMNATGLPHDNHYSSAYDLSILASHILDDYPDHASMYALKEFTFNGIRQPNRNLLLWRDPRVDGLKTGHTDAAGYCMVASARQDDTRLIAVVMGTDSEEARARETLKLLSYGFRYYKTQKLYSAGPVNATVRVWGGESSSVQVGFARDVYATMPQGDGEVTTRQELMPEVDAPIQKGQKLGAITVVRGDKTLAEAPLIAMQDVPEGGFIKRMWDSVVRFFVNLF